MTLRDLKGIFEEEWGGTVADWPNYIFIGEKSGLNDCDCTSMGPGDYYNLLGEGTKVVGMNDWALVLMNGFSAVLTEISEALTRLSVSMDY